MSGLFITGTDTEVGKTVVTSALLHGLGAQRLEVAGMKPVASGCVSTPDGLRNDDALALQQLGRPAPYELVNPFAYAEAIAPHLAAMIAARPISLAHIETCYRQLREQADLVLVEGAGGWYVPLDAQHTMADIPRRLQLDMVLVVGIRLGCINHALLTAAAIRADGLRLRGWVANHVEADIPLASAQVDSLRQRIDAPLLGILPHVAAPDPARLAAELDLDALQRAF